MTEPKRRFKLPPIVTLTEAAKARLKHLQSSGSGKLLRISVNNKGCAGKSYDMSWVDNPSDGDEVIEDDGVRFLIDRKATLFLIGSVMDWKTEMLSSRFTFENPNESGRCGCGESFTA